MNKKVLVLTLALIVAFAGSAMAEVKIGGDFIATMTQNSFKVFKDEYEFKPDIQMKITASNSNVTKTSEVVETTVVDEETGETISVLETEEKSHTNWDFSARLNSHTEKGDTLFSLERFKLEINDQYFTAWVWGKQNLTDKATYFDMIKAAKAGGNMSARVLIPVMDLADITMDFRQKDNIRVFAEGSVEGFDVGLAYARTKWTNEDEIANVLVAQVGTEVPAGDFAIDVEAAAGITLGEDLGFALGLGGETNLTEELKVEASITTANEHWNGDNVDANNTVIAAGATYTEALFQVGGDIEHTFIKDADSKNEITLGAKYRMSEKVAYNRLFNTNTSNKPMWYENDAPAFGVDVKFVDFKFDNVEAKAAAPIVDNMVWAMATGKYLGDSKFEANAFGRVVATDKLTLTQEVGYKTADKAFDVKLGASYKIGYSSTTIDFKAEKVFNEAGDGAELLQASVKVPF